MLKSSQYPVITVLIILKGDDSEREEELSDNCERCRSDLELAQLRMSACSACVQNCDGRPMCRQQCTANRHDHDKSLFHFSFTSSLLLHFLPRARNIIMWQAQFAKAFDLPSDGKRFHTLIGIMLHQYRWARPRPFNLGSHILPSKVVPGALSLGWL